MLSGSVENYDLKAMEMGFQEEDSKDLKIL